MPVALAQGTLRTSKKKPDRVEVKPLPAEGKDVDVGLPQMPQPVREHPIQRIDHKVAGSTLSGRTNAVNHRRAAVAQTSNRIHHTDHPRTVNQRPEKGADVSQRLIMAPDPVYQPFPSNDRSTLAEPVQNTAPFSATRTIRFMQHNQGSHKFADQTQTHCSEASIAAAVAASKKTVATLCSPERIPSDKTNKNDFGNLWVQFKVRRWARDRGVIARKSADKNKLQSPHVSSQPLSSLKRDAQKKVSGLTVFQESGPPQPTQSTSPSYPHSRKEESNIFGAVGRWVGSLIADKRKIQQSVSRPYESGKKDHHYNTAKPQEKGRSPRGRQMLKSHDDRRVFAVDSCHPVEDSNTLLSQRLSHYGRGEDVDRVDTLTTTLGDFMNGTGSRGSNCVSSSKKDQSLVFKKTFGLSAVREKHRSEDSDLSFCCAGDGFEYHDRERFCYSPELCEPAKSFHNSTWTSFAGAESNVAAVSKFHCFFQKHKDTKRSDSGAGVHVSSSPMEFDTLPHPNRSASSVYSDPGNPFERASFSGDEDEPADKQKVQREASLANDSSTLALSEGEVLPSPPPCAIEDFEHWPRRSFWTSP